MMKHAYFDSAVPVAIEPEVIAPRRKRNCNQDCMTSAAVITLIGASITALIATTNEAISRVAESAIVPQQVVQEINDMQWAAWPFVGAMLAVATTMILRKSDNRENAGRALGAAVLGVAGPRIVTYFHPAIKELSGDFILLVFFGYLWGMVGFAIVKAVVDWGNRKLPSMAVDAIDDATRRKLNRPAVTDKLT